MEVKMDANGIESEMFDLIRGIKDPEHPQTLEELRVLDSSAIQVFTYSHQDPTVSDSLDDIPPGERRYLVSVQFTPTVPHCSLATLIGLCIRVKLEDSYPGQLKLNVCVKEGTHETAAQISKQLNDKERVAAALENPNMRKLVDECVMYC